MDLFIEKRTKKSLRESLSGIFRFVFEKFFRFLKGEEEEETFLLSATDEHLKQKF